MSTCKDCVHVKVCREKDNVVCPCYFFKDRAKFIGLPYVLKPKDKVWYILEGLDDISLKDYKTTSGDCAVGDIPQTVTAVMKEGFFLATRNDSDGTFNYEKDEFISWNEIGDEYFLTKEEAEQALREREK